MRDSLNTEENLNDLINLHSEILGEQKAAIIQLKEDTAAGIKRYPKENSDIIFSKQIRIFSTMENLLDANYSVGNDCSLLIDLYKEGLNVLPIIGNKMGFIDIIHFTSIGVLLGIDKEVMQTVIDVFDKNNINDKLLDFIVGSYGLKRSIVSDSYMFGNPYPFLLDVVDTAKEDKSKASELLVEYIDKKWLEGHSKLGWKNLHKQGGYIGLWSYEAGAVAKILGLDDSKLINSNHYPYDLVHYIADTSFDTYVVNESDKQCDNLIVEESTYGIEACPELEKIIPAKFHKLVNQIITDYNLLSDSEMWGKYNLSEIWFTVDEYVNEKRERGLLGFIIVNCLVDEGFILQIDYKEEISDYIDSIAEFWKDNLKVVSFDLDNDQIYLAKVLKDVETKNIFEVKVNTVNFV